MTIADYLPKDLFQGKTVFITGGGSGINLGVGKAFAALGANLGICGRTRERLDNAAQELRALGAKVVAEVADVRDYPALERAMHATRDQLGPIQVLVCGAAGNFPIPAEELSPNGFKAVMDIDLLGSFHASRAAFEQLRATRGCVIFISAGMAFVPYPYQVHVGAAKAGVDNMMRNLALEWGKYGIRCNSIIPGPDRGHRGCEPARRRDVGRHPQQDHPAGTLWHGGGNRQRGGVPGLAARVLHHRHRAGGRRRAEPVRLAGLRCRDRGDAGQASGEA